MVVAMSSNTETSEVSRLEELVPPFEPHPWVKGPHLQTIVGRYWPWPRSSLRSTYAEVNLGGGDRTGQDLCMAGGRLAAGERSHHRGK